MDRSKNGRFVLTGGPGSGKTTLIDALAGAGCSIMREAGRGIIGQHEALRGPGLPSADPLLFAELMLSWDIRSHSEATDRTGPIFFDRGIPDIIGYLEFCGVPVPPHIAAATTLFPYERPVFILPPWQEIFVNDRERRQSFGEAERTYEAMVSVYRRFGYQLIEVPRAPVEERLRFVFAVIATPA